MFRTTSILMVVSLLAARAGAHAAMGQDEMAIADKMSGLVGASARVCGLIQQGESLQRGWQCAKLQNSTNSAFWLAIEERRTDSAIWHIIARSASGERYVVFYTSNEYGQPQFAPSFIVSPCHHDFELREHGPFVIGCANETP